MQLQIYMLCTAVTDEDSVVMKTEADIDDIAEYTHDDNTTTGMFCCFIFMSLTYHSQLLLVHNCSTLYVSKYVSKQVCR